MGWLGGIAQFRCAIATVHKPSDSSHCYQFNMIKTSIKVKAILFIYLGSLINSLNLLFIGDSFDRNWVNEWCEENPNTYHRYIEKANFVHSYGLIWSDTKFNDHDNRTPFFCRDDSNNDTIAQIQIFGSNLKCPYYHDRTGSMDGTEFRIRRALRDYFSNFGELVSFR